MIPNTAIVVILLVMIANKVQSYMIEIDSGAVDECFHEKVPIGVKIGFSFEVIDGGFYDIDYVIKDPNDVILFQEDKTSSGKVTIEATNEGPYRFCFSNRKSSYTPKTIIFDIERSDKIKGSSEGATSPDGSSKTDEETTKLTGMVETLLMATVSGKHDVRYLMARDRVHRRINENTNSRIVWWCGVEFILLLVVTLGQVWYLRRFFEIRRKA